MKSALLLGRDQAHLLAGTYSSHRAGVCRTLFGHEFDETVQAAKATVSTVVSVRQPARSRLPNHEPQRSEAEHY